MHNVMSECMFIPQVLSLWSLSAAEAIQEQLKAIDHLRAEEWSGAKLKRLAITRLF